MQRSDQWQHGGYAVIGPEGVEIVFCHPQMAHDHLNDLIGQGLANAGWFVRPVWVAPNDLNPENEMERRWVVALLSRQFSDPTFRHGRLMLDVEEFLHHYNSTQPVFLKGEPK